MNSILNIYYLLDIEFQGGNFYDSSKTGKHHVSKVGQRSKYALQTKKSSKPTRQLRIVQRVLREVDREHFVVACLDTKNQPTNISTVHIGSLNTSIVHPREVMKTAILSNSNSILICHSHPSGDPLNIVS